MSEYCSRDTLPSSVSNLNYKIERALMMNNLRDLKPVTIGLQVYV